MDKFNYDNLLFRELRMVAVEPSKKISDEGIVKAVTLNENLKALGYTFSPDSFVLLCISNIDNLFNTIKEFVGEVKAEPMYKGFPEEVMNMDEATYRFHQMLHYMSTYGVELFTGAQVSKGWLPESISAARDKEDTFATKLKVLEATAVQDKYFMGAKTLLSRKMLLTNSQKELVEEALTHLTAEELASLEIPFKENAQDVFYLGIKNKNLGILQLACKNPTDAFKSIEALLNRNNWHLRTSQKRLIAKLLDSFHPYAFAENIVYSAARREKVIHILDQIDYPSYSKSAANKDSFNALKDKKLKSWMSKIENLIAINDVNGLFAELRNRPGMFLRMGVRLIRLGYQKQVEENLVVVAQCLSTQTLVDIFNAYTNNKSLYEDDKIEEWDIFTNLLKKVLAAKLESLNTEIKGKKVYLDAQDFDLANSMILKPEEGGYVRSGMAFKLPQNLNKVRFFTYWNHPSRVDVDLHLECFTKDNERVSVGWNSNYKTEGAVMSGDITHSDAAEYIDIDLQASPIRYALARINLYSGAPTFADIETCFTGLMGVNELGQDIKLYDPKACYVSHELMAKNSCMNYGLINLEDKYIRYLGSTTLPIVVTAPVLSVQEYLQMLFAAQGAQKVDNKEEADLVLSIAKGGDVSVIDKNFWVDL